MQTIYRPLGATEQAVWLRDRAAPLHFALTAQIEGTIDSGHLVHALQHLQQRHPLLRAKIVLDHHGFPFFAEHISPISCRIVLRTGETQWQTEVAQELTQPFDWSVAPLMRVVLIHASEISELIVVCHHAIADGLASVNLVYEILSFLENPDQDSLSYPAPPSLESVLPQYSRASLPQKWFTSGVLKLHHLKHLLSSKTTGAQKPSLQLNASQLSAATTTQLRDRCRRENTTVHAAICTAWLFAIVLHQQVEQAIRCFMPVNLRPYLMDQLTRTCGVYIAPAQTAHAIIPQTQFWQTAQFLKANLMHQLSGSKLRRLMQQHDLLVSTNPAPELVHRLFIKNFASDIMVTNLGRLDIPQHYSSLFLRAIYGPVVLSGFEPERVCGVATLGDRLSFTVLHSDSNAESTLIRQVIQVLEQAIAQPDLTRDSAEKWLSANNQLALQNA